MLRNIPENLRYRCGIYRETSVIGVEYTGRPQLFLWNIPGDLNCHCGIYRETSTVTVEYTGRPELSLWNTPGDLNCGIYSGRLELSLWNIPRDFNYRCGIYRETSTTVVEYTERLQLPLWNIPGDLCEVCCGRPSPQICQKKADRTLWSSNPPAKRPQRGPGRPPCTETLNVMDVRLAPPEEVRTRHTQGSPGLSF